MWEPLVPRPDPVKTWANALNLLAYWWTFMSLFGLFSVYDFLRYGGEFPWQILSFVWGIHLVLIGATLVTRRFQ